MISWGKYLGYRKIRTTQERCQWHAFKLELKTAKMLGVTIRGRQNRTDRSIRDAWDDINRIATRNWKDYRKTQYKQKKERLKT